MSDYFRYGFNYEYPELFGGLQAELGRIETLRSAGARINLVGLYLAGQDEIRRHADELDRYIAYAEERGMYIFLAPAGVGFLETNPEKKNKPDESYWRTVGPTDLEELTDFLATRYGNDPHILFYLTAEPSLSQEAWRIEEEKLAGIVRKHSESYIIASVPYYQTYLSLPALPYRHVIYSTGGYVRKEDEAKREREVGQILGQKDLTDAYTVLVAEFGGNYGNNFSSRSDLAEFGSILNSLNSEKMSYTVYRLSAAYRNDGLALFDIENNLTAKGRIFVEHFND